MGLNFVDSIIIYNEYQTRSESHYYFGTRFDGVRVELTQAANQRASGLENASVCMAKIPTGTLPKPYRPPEVWRKLTTEEMLESFTLNNGRDFFVLTRKAELGIDIDLPVGMVESGQYAEGWLDYVKNKFGYAFAVDTVDVYTLIPRFEIGGK